MASAENRGVCRPRRGGIRPGAVRDKLVSRLPVREERDSGERRELSADGCALPRRRQQGSAQGLPDDGLGADHESQPWADSPCNRPRRAVDAHLKNAETVQSGMRKDFSCYAQHRLFLV